MCFAFEEISCLLRASSIFYPLPTSTAVTPCTYSYKYARAHMGRRLASRLPFQFFLLHIYTRYFGVRPRADPFFLSSLHPRREKLRCELTGGVTCAHDTERPLDPRLTLKTRYSENPYSYIVFFMFFPRIFCPAL